MIKVVQVLEATTGGTRRHLRDLLCGLDAGRFRQELVYADRRDPGFVSEDLPDFRARGIGLHRMPMRRRPAPVIDCLSVLCLTRLFRRLRPDIVHAHSAKGGFLGRLAARLAGVSRVVYSPHGFAFEMDAARPARGFYLCLERLAARWTDVCVCLCDHERRLALERLGYPADRLCLIPNGVGEMPPASSCSRASGTPGKSAHDASTGFRGDPDTEAGSGPGPVIGFIGRLCVQKGPDLLAAAAPGVLRAFPAARFRFVGDGPLRETLRRRLAGTLPRLCWELEESVDPDSARSLAGEFDVLAIPSRWEGLPYVLLDALASGTPVVAAATGGISDVLTEGCNGLLVPPRDANALETALIRLLRDASLRDRLRRAGPLRAADFSLETMLDKLSAVYGLANL